MLETAAELFVTMATTWSPGERIPEEVISKIMSYMRVADRNQAALVCKKWYHAYLDPQVQKDVVVNLTPCTSSRTIEYSGRYSVPNLCISYVDEDLMPGVLVQLLPEWLGKLTSLSLVKCHIKAKQFVPLMNHCKHLKQFRFSDCHHDLSYDTSYTSEEIYSSLHHGIQHVTDLDLSDNPLLLSDSMFGLFMNAVGCLRSLNVSGNPLLHQMSQHVPPDNPHIHIDAFLSNLRPHAKTLHTLILKSCALDDQKLVALATVPNLKLRNVIISQNESLTANGLLTFIHLQPGIIKLDISFSHMTLVKQMEKMLKQLQDLNLQMNENLYPRDLLPCFKDPECFSQLQKLSIKNCSKISPEMITHMFSRPFDNLQTLILAKIRNLDDDIIDRIVSSVPRMEHLEIHRSIMTDKGMRKIWYTLDNLKHLTIECAPNVTDYGLSNTPVPSMKVQRHRFTNSPSDVADERVTEYPADSFYSHKCSPKEYCCLQRCHKLEVLKIDGCEKITGNGLVHVIKFPALHYLDLNRSAGLTDPALVQLTRQNPSIEALYIGRCTNISTGAACAALKHLPRLHSLEVPYCYRLTDRVIEAILQSNHYLRYLDIHSCDHISPQGLAMLNSKKNLKVIW